MTLINTKVDQEMSKLIIRFPELNICKLEIINAYVKLVETFQLGGKLLVCGNGGSAADSDHIAAEFMKGFLLQRPINYEHRKLFEKMFGSYGVEVSSALQGALPTISLTCMGSIISAIANDTNSSMVYAQQVYGYGKRDDVLLLLSTSGNSENVIRAALVAKVLGISTISLTGTSGGRLAEICDINIKVPEIETYRVQEYHVCIYHFLCSLVEEEIFKIIA